MAAVDILPVTPATPIGGTDSYSTRRAEGQNRTVDTRFFRPVLYQLSYLGADRQVYRRLTHIPRPRRLRRCRVRTIEGMARFIHVRVHGVDAADSAALLTRFHRLAASRDWRDHRPWLAHPRSTSLFEQLYFAEAAEHESDGGRPLGAAGFVRIAGDETDALALLFMFRDLSERFGVDIVVRDPDNPIAKLRRVELHGGRLPDGAALEAILVRRPIFKRLRGGGRIEMYPPRALGSAFGTIEGSDRERRAWSFLVHGMRDSRPSFLEAEAEAMRMWHGLRFLD